MPDLIRIGWKSDAGTTAPTQRHCCKIFVFHPSQKNRPVQFSYLTVNADIFEGALECQGNVLTKLVTGINQELKAERGFHTIYVFVQKAVIIRI